MKGLTPSRASIDGVCDVYIAEFPNAIGAGRERATEKAQSLFLCLQPNILSTSDSGIATRGWRWCLEGVNICWVCHAIDYGVEVGYNQRCWERLTAMLT